MRVGPARWRRVFALRRAIIPHVLLAGTRPPQAGEDGPQHFVSFTDDLDDVLYDALQREELLAKRRQAPRRRRHGTQR